jgi:hypothetical protein
MLLKGAACVGNEKAHDTNAEGPPFCPLPRGQGANTTSNSRGDRVLDYHTTETDKTESGSSGASKEPKAATQSVSSANAGIPKQDEVEIDRFVNEGCPNCKDR